MAVNVPGQAIGTVASPVFDSGGFMVAPKPSYGSIEQWGKEFRPFWESVDQMAASIQANAPEPTGLPLGAPSPNTVYKDERGRLYRHVVDPNFTREPFVARADDGTEEVHERMQFTKNWVALSLKDARDATDRTKTGEPPTDFWCGFTWLRGGYSQERYEYTELQKLAVEFDSRPLVFDQTASPTDAARIRHEVANMDRRNPTLPIETSATRRRGRPPKTAPSDDTADDSLSAED